MGGSQPAADIESGSEPSATIVDLVNDHYRVLYAYAYRLTGKTNDAEDLTQQTYLIAQQKLEQLRDSSKARAWLFRVMRNHFIRSLQKKKPASASELNIEVGEYSNAGDLKDLKDIDGGLLQTAINALPEEFKVVVLMFYFDELSYKEIASELNIPIGTVMSRLARAKSALRNKISRTSLDA